jgi:hypothetical protein
MSTEPPCTSKLRTIWAIISDWTEILVQFVKRNIQTAQGRSTILNCLSFTNEWQFKMTNKTVEIALQYWIMTLKCPEEWSKVYHAFKRPWITQQSIALHSKASMRCYLSVKPGGSELVVCCWTRNTNAQNGRCAQYSAHDHEQLSACAHWRKDVIGFTAMQMKYYYDERHQPLYFQPCDMVNLCLHWGYTLSSLFTNKKLKQQFADPIKVLNWVERLAYHLNVPQCGKFTMSSLLCI